MTSINWRSTMCRAALLVLMPALPLLAGTQANTGEISGIVKDSQGGALPGATVVAEHVESRTRSERLTDQAGRFRLSSLRIGVYTITVELSGFRRLVREGIDVRLGQTLALDFALDIGGLTDEIKVSADIPLLQTANAEVSDVIEIDRSSSSL